MYTETVRYTKNEHSFIDDVLENDNCTWKFINIIVIILVTCVCLTSLLNLLQLDQSNSSTLVQECTIPNVRPQDVQVTTIYLQSKLET